MYGAIQGHSPQHWYLFSASTSPVHTSPQVVGRLIISTFSIAPAYEPMGVRYMERIHLKRLPPASLFPWRSLCRDAGMGGATVGQWGQLAPTEMRLWGQNYVIIPTEIRRARSERYK